MSFDPLHQFEVHQLARLDLMGLKLAVTNQAIWLLSAIGLVSAYLIWVSKHMEMVPGRLQSTAEVTVEFVRGMITGITGREGLKYFPFVFTLFLFIAICNVIGMVPGSFTTTSQVTVTGSLALVVFALVWIVGLNRHGLHFLSLFVPAGTPALMLPLIVPLEMISFFARPFTLAVRLVANMLAGHILLKIFAFFAITLVASIEFWGYFASIIPGLALVALSGLELFVALLQAYIFAVLTCVYLNDAIHLH